MSVLTVIGVLIAAGLAGATHTRLPASSTPLIDELNHVAFWIRQVKARKCLPPPRFRWHPGYRVPVELRERVIRWRGMKFEQIQARRSQCELAQAVRWHRGRAATCVRSREGGIASVNPAGPYFGWYQTDPAFQRVYGPEFYRRWGPGIWPASAQILTAWRGWRARGWSSWPTTARACGLL